MMRYYKLIYDYEQDDNYANCDVASIGNMDEYITISGKEIKQWGRVVFEYDSTEGNVLTDYLANPHRWFVVSENFCNKTQKILENQVQFLPVKVIDRFSGIEVDSYFVANIVTVIDALDLDNSKYDVFELDDEKIISVEKYALKSSEIVNRHIFRLKDDTIPIFISETLKKVIEDNDFTGFEFLEVDCNLDKNLLLKLLRIFVSGKKMQRSQLRKITPVGSCII